MPGPFFEQTMLNLKPGDHLCCIYETEEEHRQVLTPFLRHGLEHGDKVLYIVDTRTAETVVGYLQRDGLDISSHLARGQIHILASHETYTQCGAFVPEDMIALLQTETQQALAEGYQALRVTGEMTWALHGLPGSERLIEYEARLNDFLPHSQCLAICQYDRRRFAPKVLLDVLRTHPIAVIGTEIYANFYYVPPAELLSGDPAAELERWINNLQEHKHVEDALRESELRFKSLFEVLPVGVGLLDEQGKIVNVNPALEKILGGSREQLLSNADGSWQYLDADKTPLPPDEFPTTRALREKRAIENIELGIVKHDGTSGWVSASAIPFMLPGLSVALTLVDITERKQAEQARLAQLEHELTTLQRLTDGQHTATTAQLFGVANLSQRLPDTFGSLVEHYSVLLEQALEEQIYKVDHRLSDKLRALAGRLGVLRAGPRDVIEIHTAALKRTNQQAPPLKVQAYAREGLLIAFELMGYLVTFYRNRLGRSA